MGALIIGYGCMAHVLLEQILSSAGPLTDGQSFFGFCF
jgi:hypothetical protein